MGLPIRFRVLTFNDSGLKNAPKILADSMRGSLEGIGKRLRASAQSRMREDRGVTKKSLRIVVKGSGLGLRLEVFSVLVQAFVDAYGIDRGRLFPPFNRASKLHAWALRKARGIESKRVPGAAKGSREISHLKSRRPKRPLATAKVSRVKKKRNVPLTAAVRNKSLMRDADRIAFLAARSIYEKGIRATHWNKKALDANRQLIIRDLKNGLLRAVNRINRG